MTYQPPPPPPQGPPPQGPPPQVPPPQGAYPGQVPPPPPPNPQSGQPSQPVQPGQYGQPSQYGQPGQYGQPAPQGQWGTPGGQPTRSGSSFDPKTVNQLDWGILAAGVLAFIFSFVSYYTYSAGGASASQNAWHGFFGWFAMLLALIGSAAVAVELFMPHVKLPYANRLIGLAAYALATLCVILALFIVPDYFGVSIPGLNKGHGFGYWISLIVIVAGLVLSVLRFQQTGGELPLGKRGAGTSSAPPAAGGYNGPTQSGGYGPPPGPPSP